MKLVALAVLVLVATFAADAQADIVVPEPRRDACAGKASGDACDFDGTKGECFKTKCSRNVGGVLEPRTIEEECMLCGDAKVGEKVDPKTPAKTDPPKPEPTTPEPAKDEPAKEEPAKADPPADTPAKSEPAKSEPAKSEPAKNEPAKSSGCSVPTEATPLASAVFGLVLLVLARPRRR